MTTSQPLRQLVVIAEMGSGGAESIVVQLARHAVAHGDDVLVASAGGWRTAVLTDLGARHLPVPLDTGGWRPLLRAARTLRRQLAETPVDVVHVHNVRVALAAWLAVLGRRHRPRVLVTVHGLESGRYQQAARILRLVADHTVAVSDDVGRRLHEGGLDPARLEVVVNAPDVPAPVDRVRARSELGLPDETPVVLCLARLAPPKRQDLLLRAWGDVPDALLLVAGDGVLRPELEAQAERLGIADRVRFLGDRRDVGRLLGAADALVLPSDSEGLPVAVLEAMSSGVPVVASRVGGLGALDARCLQLVEPGSAAALADGVRAVLDRENAAGLVGRARALVDERYSSRAMGEAYETRLRALAGRTGRPKTARFASGDAR